MPVSRSRYLQTIIIVAIVGLAAFVFMVVLMRQTKSLIDTTVKTSTTAGPGSSTAGSATSPTSTVAPMPAVDLSTVPVEQVVPSATDAAIGSPDAPNEVSYDPAVRSNGELFVFLPGTGGSPSCCTLVLKEAASLGFHAIGLTYPNATAVATRCQNDLVCYGTVRANEFDGSSSGPQSDVVAGNAIDHRLVALLRYLSVRHPDQGWTGFLSGGDVSWSSTVVAGHSQGGGEAAYVGVVRVTAGVVMLSSDVDSSSASPPVAAPYLTGHLDTPSSRFVGFDHTGDPFYAKIRSTWDALGLGFFGGPVSVDTVAPPYKGSHELVTSATVPQVIALPEHDSTAVDIETPRCADGMPQFAPVWVYMMQVAGGLPVSGGASGHGGCG